MSDETIKQLFERCGGANEYTRADFERDRADLLKIFDARHGWTEQEVRRRFAAHEYTHGGPDSELWDEWEEICAFESVMDPELEQCIQCGGAVEGFHACQMPYETSEDS